MSEETQPLGEPASQQRTPETRWSVVLQAAGGPQTGEATRALGQLCETYWQTLYRLARKRGQRDEEARDLVQEFICRLLEGKQSLRLVDPERGRFRNFLWTCFHRYLADKYKASTRQKAGGDLKRYSLDMRGMDDRLLLEPVEKLPPEDAFRKSVALDTFQEAYDQLQAAWVEKGRREKFEHLQEYLSEDCKGSKARTLAGNLHVTESRARGLVTELRQQFRTILRDKVAQTLSEPTESDIDSELEWLWQAICL